MARPEIVPVNQLQQAVQTGVTLALEEREIAKGKNGVLDPWWIFIGLILN